MTSTLWGRLALALFASALWITPAAHGQIAVDLELVLAVDASRSIDEYEHELQRQGYAQAFVHPQVLRTIARGEHGRIAVVYVEWSGEGEAAILVDWTVIDGKAAAAGFAQEILAAPRRFDDGTAVGDAIDYAARLFAENGIDAPRQVIDVSGDGPSNRGRRAILARDDAVARGITINGLAILNDRPSRPPWPEIPVDEYYRSEVIGGRSAFVMVVRGFSAFAEGIRKKLIREIPPEEKPTSSVTEKRGRNPA